MGDDALDQLLTKQVLSVLCGRLIKPKQGRAIRKHAEEHTHVYATTLCSRTGYGVLAGW